MSNFQNITIKPRYARDYILDRQQLRSTNRKGKAATLEAIERIGYVQIDTISVIARAHHHVLRTRIADYHSDYLRRLEEEDRQVFEYWSHAAAYLPTRDYRYSLYRKAEIAAGKGHWREKDPRLMARVLQRLEAEGPLMSKDFKKDFPGPTAEMWANHPANWAFRQLFMEGKIMVTGRRGFQKVYDLPERVLPDWVDQRMPAREDYLRYVIGFDIRAQGLVRLRDMGHLLKIKRPELQAQLQAMVEEGLLLEVEVEGLGAEPFYAFREDWEAFERKRRKKRMHILSPFDNLIIRRRRLEELFDFQYILECYVPQAKRKVGYFSLPLLWGTDFVGQIDLKADRKKRQLLIRNLVWEQIPRDREAMMVALRSALQAFQDFNACEQIILPSALQNRTGFTL
ncbi:MAG: crosslink repair DNA glycosylase YcaQ family protein [Bacteroidota bacterium]